MTSVEGTTDVRSVRRMVNAKCLGIDTFHFKWRLQVMMLPPVLVCGPLIYYCFERRNEPQAAGPKLIGRIFFP